MDITKDMDKMAETLEKSSGSEELSAYESLKATVLEIGVEGLKKSIPNLSKDQKTLLKSVLEDIKKSAYDVEPHEQTTVNGEQHKNEAKPQFDKDDEEVASAAKDSHRNQGGVPIPGWEGQVIKSEDGEKCMTKGKEGSTDEKQDKQVAKQVAENEVKDHEMEMHKKKDKMKKSFKALVERMIERKLEKSKCVSILSKNMETSEEQIGQIWDALEKAMSYSYDDSTKGSDVPEKSQVKADNAVAKEMKGNKPEASVEVPAYKDKSAENSTCEDDVAKQKNETADEGQKPPKTMNKSEANEANEELDFKLEKAQDPFLHRKHGQNAHFSVDAHNAEKYVESFKKSKFDWTTENQKLEKSVNDILEAGEDLAKSSFFENLKTKKDPVFSKASFSEIDMDELFADQDYMSKSKDKEKKKKKKKGRGKTGVMGVRG